MNASLALVALSTGGFAREGLDVTVRWHDFGKLALADVLDGRADIAVTSEAPVVFATLRGERPVFLATISSSTRSTRLLARADEVSGPADLAGKRVGVPFDTSGRFFVTMLLARHGLDPSRVQLVDLLPQQFGDALAHHDVDAVVAWHPRTLEFERRFPGELVSLHADSDYWTMAGVVATSDRAKARPEVMKKVIRALVGAEVVVRDRPGEAKRVVSEAIGVPPADLEAVWGDYRFRVGLDQSLLVLMDAEARWAVRSESSRSGQKPDFFEAIAPEPLLAVRPEADRMIGLAR